MKLPLAIKFNIVFLMIFTICFISSSLLANYLLQKSARDDSLERVRMLMSAAAAASAYTSEQVVPLLANRLKYEFLPQSIPSFAATEQLHKILESYPEFTYKPAMLNPTNLRDKAVGWEVEIVNQLRKEPDNRELVGERLDAGNPSLYMAHPIKITDPTCLSCHSIPENAPKTVTDKYGTLNGFGWKLNEIVGARLVSVPLAVPLARANALLRTYMLSMLGIFVILFCSLNVMVHIFITRRLKRLSDLADRVSLGESDAPEIDVDGGDELARIAQSFVRMRTSLDSAMHMLEE